MPKALKLGQGQDRVVKLAGQEYIVFNYTAGSNSDNVQQLTPGLVTRLQTISDAYNLYRFTHIRIEKPPCTELNGGSLMASNIVQGIAVVMDTVDTYPSTVQRLSEFPYMMVYSPGSMTVPRSFEVPRSALSATAGKWFKTKVGTPEEWEEVQGLILVQDENASETSTSAYVLHYEIEFSDPCPTADTPELLEARLRQMRMRSQPQMLHPHLVSKENGTLAPYKKKAPLGCC